MMPIWDDKPPSIDRMKLMWSCDGHYRMYREAIWRDFPGFDPPKNANDLWRGSIIDGMRLACIRVAHEDRKKVRGRNHL